LTRRSTAPRRRRPLRRWGKADRYTRRQRLCGWGKRTGQRGWPATSRKPRRRRTDATPPCPLAALSTATGSRSCRTRTRRAPARDRRSSCSCTCGEQERDPSLLVSMEAVAQTAATAHSLSLPTTEQGHARPSTDPTRRSSACRRRSGAVSGALSCPDVDMQHQDRTAAIGDSNSGQRLCDSLHATRHSRRRALAPSAAAAYLCRGRCVKGA
jgi:hypothetical protein